MADFIVNVQLIEHQDYHSIRFDVKQSSISSLVRINGNNVKKIIQKTLFNIANVVKIRILSQITTIKATGVILKDCTKIIGTNEYVDKDTAEIESGTFDETEQRKNNTDYTTNVDDQKMENQTIYREKNKNNDRMNVDDDVTVIENDTMMVQNNQCLCGIP